MRIQTMNKKLALINKFAQSRIKATTEIEISGSMKRLLG